MTKKKKEKSVLPFLLGRLHTISILIYVDGLDKLLVDLGHIKKSSTLMN